jgi:predicted permease
MAVTLEALGVLALYAAVGWVLHGRRVLGAAVGPALSVLALDVALPCLVFASIAERFRPVDFPGWWRLPLLWAVFTAAAGLASLAAGLTRPAAHRREFVLCLFYQNAIFFPLALLTQMFGGTSREVVLLFLFAMFFSAFLFGSYAALFGGGARGRVPWRRVLHPVLFATLLAVGAGAAGLGARVPGFLMSALRGVGRMSVPLVMMLIGSKLRADVERRSPFHVRDMLWFVLWKNLLFPLAAIGLVGWLQPPRELALLLVLQAAVPPVTVVPLIAERAGRDGGWANQALMSSFAALVVTLPLMMVLLDRVLRS